MIIRLDTNGLRKLIEDNPSFKLEIQKNVMDNIKSDQMVESINTRINQVLDGMITKSGGWNPKYSVKDAKLLEALKSTVSQVVEELAQQKIENLTMRIVEQERAKIRNELTNITKEALMSAITPEIAKEILLKKLV